MGSFSNISGDEMRDLSCYSKTRNVKAFTIDLNRSADLPGSCSFISGADGSPGGSSPLVGPPLHGEGETAVPVNASCAFDRAQIRPVANEICPATGLVRHHGFKYGSGHRNLLAETRKPDQESGSSPLAWVDLHSGYFHIKNCIPQFTCSSNSPHLTQAVNHFLHQPSRLPDCSGEIR